MKRWLIGFVAGLAAIVVAAWWFNGVVTRQPVVVVVNEPGSAATQAPLPADTPAVINARAAATAAPQQSDTRSDQVIDGDPIASLRRRTLDVPVQGVERGALRESFDEMREGTRRHNGIDILAPRNTPVVAVEDGVIAKLFTSEAGGLTIYQFDPGSEYVYYYAHLDRYADGLKDGLRVLRHQVIGYVGTTGNAPKETPHLHFEISKLTPAKQWWKSSPIDPYRILK